MIKRIKSHKVLSFLLFLIPLLLIWIIWGNTHIETKWYKLIDDEVPSDFDNYTIAQVSDLHNKDWGNKLIRELEAAYPDIIVVTGDLIDSRNTDIPVAVEFIERAAQIAPVYFVTGNHEARSSQYEELIEAINQTVILLDNRTFTLSSGVSELTLLGIEDPSFLGADPENELESLTEDVEGFKILLSHRPELFDLYVKQDIDLVFSGHAHGGQFRLPFIGGLIAPDQGLFPKYTEGIYTEEDTNMVVSRGLGNSLFPFRINNKPELIFLRFSTRY